MQGTSLALMQHGILAEVIKKQEWLDSPAAITLSLRRAGEITVK